MTKTKAQLRAEAVERLRSMDEWCDEPHISYDFMRALLGPSWSADDEKRRDALIDLLTDEPTNGDTDGIPSVTNEITLDAANTDSREKLEEDVNRFSEMYAILGTNNSIREHAIGWLDRQAAITGRYWQEVYEASVRVNDDLRDQIDELNREVTHWKGEAKTQRNNYEQATGARAHWQRKYENVCKKRDELEAELYAKQGALDIAVKNESNLEQRIIELEKDNDRLMQKVADAKVGAIGCPAYNPETHYCKWHCADFELNGSTLLKLRQDNYALRNENDSLTELIRFMCVAKSKERVNDE